ADCLRRAIHALNLQRVLVFMNYQDRLKDVMFKLQARNMKSACLHGEMSKLARANVLNDFRRGRSRALVVSDVVSRGLDVSAIDAVFNAELPSSASHYAHRAGRTGRMDAPGTVISIVTRAEMFVVEKLSKRLGVPIIEAHISHGEMVLGPAPETLRYDDDDKEDGRRGRSSGSKVEAGSDDASSSSSSSSKAGEAESGRKDAAVRGADAVASSSKAEAAPAKPRRERKPKAEPDSDDEDSDDDEDDAALDIGALERRLAADKAAAGARSPAARGGAGGSSGAGRGGGSDASGFKTELQRELEELRVERRARKVARRTGGGGGDGAGRSSCSPILKRASVVIWATLFSPVQSIGAPPQSSAIHRKAGVAVDAPCTKVKVSDGKTEETTEEPMVKVDVSGRRSLAQARGEDSMEPDEASEGTAVEDVVDSSGRRSLSQTTVTGGGSADGWSFNVPGVTQGSGTTGGTVTVDAPGVEVDVNPTGEEAMPAVTVVVPAVYPPVYPPVYRSVNVTVP
ncbi:hypothetical protein FOA52_013812, partial [Chlamydomonas sp. UWO 241]